MVAPFLAAALVLPCAAQGAAWRVVTDRPAAVRGGVLALQLACDLPPPQWPRTLAATLDGGTTVQGPVALILPEPPPDAPQWTSPAEEIWVGDPASPPAGLRGAVDAAMVLFLQMPEGFSGGLDVGGTRVSPAWLDPSPPPASSAEPLQWPGTPRADRPAGRGMNEWWRWVLLGRRLEAAPPAERGSERERLHARHLAQLWCAGLERVGRASPGVKAELLELLTATVKDEAAGGDVAAWMARPGDLTSLLSLLVDPGRGDQDVMRAALAWCRARTPLTVWVESDAGAEVRVAVANPQAEEVVVRATWLGDPGGLPEAILVPARSVGRARLERPARAAPPAGEALPGEVMILAAQGWQGRFPVGPASFPVRPPGLSLAQFLPALTLAGAQSQRIEPAPPDVRTLASLRRLGPHWELFAECLSPGRLEGDSLEIRAGDPAHPAARVRISPDGRVEAVEGSVPADLTAHCRVAADRWRCRVELPASWMPQVELGRPGRPLEVAVSRLPGAARGRQTAVLAVPPWVAVPAVRAELSTWVDLPEP